MSPREQRRGGGGGGGRRPRGTRGSTGRRRGRTAVVVLGAIALVVVGVLVGAVAVIFGLVPGFRVRSPIERLATDSAAVDTTATPQVVTTAPDSAPHPAAVSTDTFPLVAAPGMVTPADSAAGEVVFRGAGRCLSCHGTTGDGVAQLGPSLRDARWITGDGSLEAIARTIREGVLPPKEFPIAMPAYAKQLPEEAIGRVAAYVYAISHAGSVQHDSLTARPDSLRLPAAAPAPTVPATAAPAVPRPTVPRPTVPR